MTRNLGATSLRRKSRNEDPMREFDRLPAELRSWLASAILPWRPRSVQQVFNRALARTKDESHAFLELDQLQDRLVAKDVRRIWGRDHPHGCSTSVAPTFPPR